MGTTYHVLKIYLKIKWFLIKLKTNTRIYWFPNRILQSNMLWSTGAIIADPLKGLIVIVGMSSKIGKLFV